MNYLINIFSYRFGNSRKNGGEFVILKRRSKMEDLEDSEIQFSEWTESGDFEFMDTEDGDVQQLPNDQSFPTAIADKLEERIEGPQYKSREHSFSIFMKLFVDITSYFSGSKLKCFLIIISADSPRNLRPPVFCFPFECDGKMFFIKEVREVAALNGYLGHGVLEG